MTDEELLAELERKFQAAKDDLRQRLIAQWDELMMGELGTTEPTGLRGLLDDIRAGNPLHYGGLRRPTADPTADTPTPPRTAPDASS